jgi:hypothetical protein
MEAMNQAAQTIGAKMYQSQAGSAQGGQAGTGAPGAEQPKKDEQGPVEGEYQEKK